MTTVPAQWTAEFHCRVSRKPSSLVAFARRVVLFYSDGRHVYRHISVVSGLVGQIGFAGNRQLRVVCKG